MKSKTKSFLYLLVSALYWIGPGVVNRSSPVAYLPLITLVSPFLAVKLRAIVCQYVVRISPSAEDLILKGFCEYRGCRRPEREGFYPAGKVVRDRENEPFSMGGPWVRPHEVDADSFPCGGWLPRPECAGSACVGILCACAQVALSDMLLDVAPHGWPPELLLDGSGCLFDSRVSGVRGIMVLMDDPLYSFPRNTDFPGLIFSSSGPKQAVVDDVPLCEGTVFRVFPASFSKRREFSIKLLFPGYFFGEGLFVDDTNRVRVLFLGHRRRKHLFRNLEDDLMLGLRMS